MDDQAEGLGQRMAAVERDVAVIRSNYATKKDLHREIAALTWKLVTFVCGFGTVLVSVTWFIVTHTK